MGAPTLFDVSQTYFLGVEVGTTCNLIIANVLAPETNEVGFPCNVDLKAVHMRPDGSLLYIGSAQTTIALHAFTADSWSGASYPASPVSNDSTIPTPACDGASGGFLEDFLIAPDTGAVIYKCTDGNWYDGSGAVRFTSSYTPLALGGNNTAVVFSNNNSTFGVDDGSGTFHVFAPIATTDSLVAARWNSASSTFSMAFSASSGPLQLVHTDLQGNATVDNTYDTFASTVENYGSLLDQNDALYVTAKDPSSSTVRTIIQLTPGGGTTTLYTESAAPADNFGTSPPSVYPRELTAGAPLIAAP